MSSDHASYCGIQQRPFPAGFLESFDLRLLTLHQSLSCPCPSSAASGFLAEITAAVEPSTSNQHELVATNQSGGLLLPDWRERFEAGERSIAPFITGLAMTDRERSLLLGAITALIELSIATPAEQQALTDGARLQVARYLARRNIAVTENRPRKRGRPKADYATVRREAKLASDWQRAKASVLKAEFARQHGMTLRDFQTLLSRVNKRKTRAD